MAHGSTWTRRLAPAAATFRLIDAYASWAHRTETWPWPENLRFHEQLWAHTPLAGEEGEIARRAISEFFKCVEIFWRPWLVDRGEVEGLHSYYRARAEGRGVIVVFPHFGIANAMPAVMATLGSDIWLVLSPHHYEDLGDGYAGRFARQTRAYVDRLGPGHGIARTGGKIKAAPVIWQLLDLLADGATVLIAFDVVGKLETPFLGRTVRLASGPAKAAIKSGSLVVPMVTRRRGAIPVLRFGDGIDPLEFDGADALQAQIARVMEEWALELPEAVWPLHTQPGGPPLINGVAPTAELTGSAPEG
jgi:lauroyl/myristoyl acyltransferase